MGYADGIPSQAVFDAYYESRSKYENQEREGEVSRYDAARFVRVAENIQRLAPDRSQRILEVGASTGGMLGALRNLGFKNLMGIDPSPACKDIAARHGLRVENATPASLAREGDSFNLIILLAVLEHVRDLAPFVGALEAILSPGGALYIQVPDAGAFHRWPDAPFQQFSTEHINFFSGVSLGSLMRMAGFIATACEKYSVEGGPGYVMPVVDMLCTPTVEGPERPAIPRDEETEAALLEYISLSEKEDKRLGVIMARLAECGREIIVWGAGTHTQRLLADDRMTGVRIAAYVDSNPHVQGSSLGGKPILTPDDLRTRAEPILVSSRCFQEDIRSQIEHTLGLKNEIITLYDL